MCIGGTVLAHHRGFACWLSRRNSASVIHTITVAPNQRAWALSLGLSKRPNYGNKCGRISVHQWVALLHSLCALSWFSRSASQSPEPHHLDGAAIAALPYLMRTSRGFTNKRQIKSATTTQGRIALIHVDKPTLLFRLLGCSGTGLCRSGPPKPPCGSSQAYSRSV
jgi:hypothetical protein